MIAALLFLPVILVCIKLQNVNKAMTINMFAGVERKVQLSNVISRLVASNFIALWPIKPSS